MKNKLILLLFSIFFSILLISCDNTEKINSNNINNTDIKNNENIVINEDKNENLNLKTEAEDDELKNVRLFYFDTVDYNLYYVDKEIKVNDKAIIKALTKELQDYSPNNNFLNLTDKVEITSSNLDEENKILKIVFSSSYVNEMLLGSSTESGLLSSLLCTYGYNLNVDKISIYFNDELYTSLRGDLPNGYFDVDYSTAIPYSEDKNISSEDKNTSNKVLSNIKNMNCRVYYYDVNEDVYYYQNKSIEVTDGALVKALTQAMKNLPNEKFFKFDDDLAIKSAELKDGTLTVNLSSTYYNILTRVGSGTEAAALKTLALTYGYNYNVDKVIILVDGKPYKGSHMMYEANEAININTTNIKEYKRI